MAEAVVKSVKKALDALDWIALAQVKDGGATLTDIAAALDEKTPTMRNLLKTMEICGYLARKEKKYVLGGKCGDLRRGLSGARLLAAARPLLARAAQDTGDSFVLTTLMDGRRVVLARFPGGGEVVVNVEIESESGRVYELVTTRAMLAFAGGDAVERCLARYGPPGDEWPEAHEHGLSAALAAVREDGLARANNRMTRALAAPVLAVNGELLGAVGLFMPDFRADAQHEGLMDRLLRGLARDVRERME